MTLRRYAPLRRGPRKDPVTPDLREEVLLRDGRCVAPVLDRAAGECRGRTTLDHVRDAPMMGKRAPSDARHLAAVCEFHHLYGWSTSHRMVLRAYLATVGA